MSELLPDHVHTPQCVTDGCGHVDLARRVVVDHAPAVRPDDVSESAPVGDVPDIVAVSRPFVGPTIAEQMRAEGADELATLRAELAAARETIARLNRRCQKVEGALGDKLTRLGLFHAGLGMYVVQRDAARDECALWKATSDAHATVIEQDLVPLRVLLGDPAPVGGTVDVCAAVKRLIADRDRLRDACARQNDEVSQTLGKALGYPRYADDPMNFPVCVGESQGCHRSLVTTAEEKAHGRPPRCTAHDREWYPNRDAAIKAADAAGVCVGDHVAETLAEEAVRRILAWRRRDEVDRAKWLCEFCYARAYTDRMPASWGLVWHSGVCGDCLKRVEQDGGFGVVNAGAYAEVPDPRSWMTDENAPRYAGSQSAEEAVRRLRSLADERDVNNRCWHEAEDVAERHRALLAEAFGIVDDLAARFHSIAHEVHPAGVEDVESEILETDLYNPAAIALCQTPRYRALLDLVERLRVAGGVTDLPAREG